MLHAHILSRFRAWLLVETPERQRPVDLLTSPLRDTGLRVKLVAVEIPFHVDEDIAVDGNGRQGTGRSDVSCSPFSSFRYQGAFLRWQQFGATEVIALDLLGGHGCQLPVQRLLLYTVV